MGSLNVESELNMDCKTTLINIDDYLDDMLDSIPTREFQTHIALCRDCRNRLEHEQEFRETLRSLPAPTPNPEFEKRAFIHAEKVYTSSHRINTSVIMKIAASILIVVALGFLFNSIWKSSQTEGLDVLVRLNQPEEIKLVFYSKESLRNVSFSLIPSDGIEPIGFGNQQEIVWQGNLEKGDNLLVVPLITRNRKGGTLVVAIRYGSQNKQFHLRLQVKQPNNPTSGREKLENNVFQSNLSEII